MYNVSASLELGLGGSKQSITGNLTTALSQKTLLHYANAFSQEIYTCLFFNVKSKEFLQTEIPVTLGETFF